MKQETIIRKRVVSILMVIAMICSGIFIPPARQTQIVRAAESDDSEEVEEPYIEITNVSELYAIRNNLSGKYRLMNDIDLTEATAEGGEVNNTGHGWDPIDDFSGVLDGNGHVIKGMKIYGEMEGNVGLFGSVKDGIILNLGMVDVDIDVEYNCSKSSGFCGAIIGRAESSIHSISLIGGETDPSVYMINCFVTGRVRTIIKKGDAEDDEGYDCGTGGIVGYSYNGGIENSYNLAEVCSVDSKGNYCPTTAGVVGNTAYSQIIGECYNVGKINNGEGYAVMYWLNEKDWNCEEVVSLKGTGIGIGTPLTEAQMKNTNYFTGWDFDTVWEIDPYSNYKYPQLKSCRQKRVKSLEIATPPAKMEYNQGEPLDISGATVKVTYEDGLETTIFLTEDMLGDYDMMAVGKQQIPVNKANATTSLEINVNGIPVTGVSLNKSNTSIYKGYSEQLSASVLPENATNKGIVWSSADETIATVSQDGTVTAKNPGTVAIRATSQEGVTAECQVTVAVPSVILQLDAQDIKINKGDTYILTYKLSPVDSTDTVKWTSSNDAVLHVDDKNQFIGVDAGVVTVTGVTGSGVSAVCTVTVMQDLSEFTVLNIKDKNYTGKPVTQKPKVTNGAKTLRAGVDYSVEYSSNVNVGRATIKIVGMGAYKGTLTKEFNILPEGTSNQSNTAGKKITVPRASISSIKASSKKLVVKWKRAKNAVGYKIEMAKNRAFTRGKKTYTVGKNTLKKTLKGAKKTTYYVRVQAYAYDTGGQIHYGAYSKVKKKKTK